MAFAGFGAALAAAPLFGLAASGYPRKSRMMKRASGCWRGASSRCKRLCKCLCKCGGGEGRHLEYDPLHAEGFAPGDDGKDNEADDEDSASVASNFSALSTASSVFTQLGSSALGFGASPLLRAGGRKGAGGGGGGGAPYSLFAACVRRVVRRHDTRGACSTAVLVVLAGFGVPALCALNLGLYVWAMDTTLSSAEGDVKVGGIQDVLTVFDLTLFTALSVFKDASACQPLIQHIKSRTPTTVDV